jgi:hypothetical protein
MEFKIETATEDMNMEQNRRAFFPFGQLKVGQFFIVPLNLADKARDAVKSFNQTRYRRFGIRIRTKTVTGGLRCMRVS